MKEQFKNVVDAIRSARSNAGELELTIIESPIADPRDLRMDDMIYGIKLVPVTDSKNPELNSTRMTVGIVDEVVQVIDGRDEKNFIINGRIEMPKKKKALVKIEDAYFTDSEAAAAVARCLVEYEFEKAQDEYKALEAELRFYKDQIENDRY